VTTFTSSQYQYLVLHSAQESNAIAIEPLTHPLHQLPERALPQAKKLAGAINIQASSLETDALSAID